MDRHGEILSFVLTARQNELDNLNAFRGGRQWRYDSSVLPNRYGVGNYREVLCYKILIKSLCKLSALQTMKAMGAREFTCIGIGCPVGGEMPVFV